MIENKGLLELYNVGVTTDNKYRKLSAIVLKAFVRTIDKIKPLADINALKAYNSLRYEKLYDDYKGYESIRVNDQYRIIFKSIENDNSLTIYDIVIFDLSKHYEN